ncbi:hypothetical protein Tco_0662118 [Tanacetum coccineum]
MLCKQESKGFPLRAEHNEWIQDTDEKSDELEAHYMYMDQSIQSLHATDDNSGPAYDVEPLEKVHTDDDFNVFATKRQHFEQPESINDTYVVEKVDSNVIPDSSDMCDNEVKDDQNVEELKDERVLLASLIANLKLDVDVNKKIQKQLKKTNTSLTQDLKKSKQDLFIANVSLRSIKFFKQTTKTKRNLYLNVKKLLVYLQKLNDYIMNLQKLSHIKLFVLKKKMPKVVNQISTHERRISQILKENEQ